VGCITKNLVNGGLAESPSACCAIGAAGDSFGDNDKPKLGLVRPFRPAPYQFGPTTIIWRRLTSPATDIGPPRLPFVHFELLRRPCHFGADPHPGRGNLEMINGTVKFFNTAKGYGFITPEGGGNDAFVHISALERAGLTTLASEQRVSYELETNDRGKTSAVNLQLL